MTINNDQKIREDNQNLHYLYLSVGLDVSGCDAQGNVHLNQPDVNNLAPLVVAAHGKPIISDECVALQTALGGSEAETWLAYIAARQQPIRQQRQERYKVETDPIFMKAFEESSQVVTINSVDYVLPLEESIQAWKDAKIQIRTELPYD